jgi:ubiquinol-cytochrome c reductase cytochrome c subunit
VLLVPTVVALFVLVVRPAVVTAAPAADARTTWLSDCAVCHGVTGTGTDLGPSLRGVGRASVDYELSTGRMPLVETGHLQPPNPQAQPLPVTEAHDPQTAVHRHPPAYDQASIDGLVAYVGALVADPGPPVPNVEGGSIPSGGQLYRANCAACHSWSGGGGALVHREAPPLDRATPVQVAEAIRVGPGQMPSFGAAALTDQQVDDVVSYVGELQRPDDRGGLPLHHVGPVAEGAVGLVALAAIAGMCLWIGERS